MSEPKRVAFTTISGNVIQSTLPTAGASAVPTYRTVDASSVLAGNKSSLTFGNNGPTEGDGEQSGKQNKTVRLEMALFQTDSSKYPEFNYSRLLHLQKKKLKKQKTRTNGFPDDPMETGKDDDVARIAREFEKKYGSTHGSGRSRSARKNNVGEKAMGYDESDSFIDNTEAFDEVIPEEVETLEGGFYINCGALEFKKLQTELATTKTDEIIKMPNRPKKRDLSTSSSEDSSTTEEDDEADDDEEEDEEADDSSTTNNRQKSGNSSSSTTTSVATKKSQITEEKKSDGTKQICLSSVSNSPKPLGEEQGSDSDKDRVPVKTITVKEMLKAKRDSFLKSQAVDDKSTNLNGQAKSAGSRTSNDEDDDSTTSSDDSEDSGDSGESAEPAQIEKKASASPIISTVVPVVQEENNEKTEAKLPPGLSADLLENLRIFKEIGIANGMLGKKFQFDERATEQFLKIDNCLKSFDKTNRNIVLAHLDFHFLLPKYYFLRKAKQLRIKEEKQKSKRVLAKLRKSVIETMPSAIAEYELELHRFADLNAANINLEQSPIMPKKEFAWNNDLRNLLYEVYDVRLSSYEVLRTRKETFEEFINEYLRGKVIEVWPNGWMQLNDLLREIEKVKAYRSKLQKEHIKKDVNVEVVTATQPTITTATTSTEAVVVPTQQTVANATDMMGTTTVIATTGSTTTAGNKRKHGDGTRKPRKNKTQKKDNNYNNGPTDLTNKTLPMPSTDYATNLQQQQKLQQQQQQQTLGMQTTAAAFSAFQQQIQQQHSMQNSGVGVGKAAHVIDLDNYKSANDILQTSKQIINAAQKQQQQGSVVATNLFGQPTRPTVNDSSSESDGVEIVGVYQNKPAIGKSNNIKHKNNTANKNLDPLALPHMPNIYPNATAANNLAVNLNNNSTNYNRKKAEIEAMELKKLESTTTMGKNTAQSRLANNQ